MPHNQAHQQCPCRITIYVSEELKAWVYAEADLKTISVSQFVAKILEQTQLNSKGSHAI